MENLSLKELRLIAKNRNIKGYKIMLEDKLLGITNNNNNNNNKDNNKGDRKSLFKSEKEEIRKIIYDPKNNLFKPEEDHYKSIRIGNAFSSNYIEYKSNGDKDKSLSVK